MRNIKALLLLAVLEPVPKYFPICITMGDHDIRHLPRTLAVPMRL